MNHPTVSSEVAGYLTRLRAELADLPAAEVEEIVDEIGPHVAEVATELGDEDLERKLVERLGSPEQYAAELRTAAGYPPRSAAAPAPPRPNRAAPRLALLGLLASIVLAFLIGASVRSTNIDELAQPFATVAFLLALGSLLVVLRRPDGVAELAALPEVAMARAAIPANETVTEWARRLQPAWWLIRAGLAALLVMLVFGWSLTLLLVLGLVFAAGSLWLGVRSQTDRRWLWLVLPLNAFAIGLGAAAVDSYSPYPITYADYVPSTSAVPPYSNIFVYDENGNRIDQVYLFDSEGNPITLPYADQCEPRQINRYPLPEVEYSTDGECREVPATPRGEIPFTGRNRTGTTTPVPTSPPQPTVTTPAVTTTG